MTARPLILSTSLLALFMLQPARFVAAEESEPPESAVSSPPMEMDDPGTPGSRGIELNLVGTLARAGVGRGSETLLDANYGIGHRIQLKFERPYLTEGAIGAPTQHGLGATELGVKWRFIDRSGWEVAFYPQYSFDDGFVLKDEEGNPEDTEGRIMYLPLLASRQIHTFYTLAANLGYRRNLEGFGDDVDIAMGAGRSFGSDARVLAELFSERDPQFNNRQTDVRIGCAGVLFPGLFEHSSLEIGEFGSVGHSIGATEIGEPTTSITFGITLLKKPKDEGSHESHARTVVHS